MIRIEHKKIKYKKYIKEFNSHIRHYFYHIFLTLCNPKPNLNRQIAAHIVEKKLFKKTTNLTFIAQAAVV